jgi:hypothetical protein
MVRAGRARAGLISLLVALPLAAALGQLAAARAPRDFQSEALLLLSTVYLGFAVLALLAALSAGGGAELFPPGQLVAFPVRPATVFLAAVLLAPLNFAWSVQLVMLLTTVAYATAGTGTEVVAVTTGLTYAVVATVTTHALAWIVVGVRRTSSGRTASWLAAATAIAILVGLVRSDRLTAVLDSAPTTWVVLGSLQEPNGRWALTVAVLAAVLACASATGIAACAWALRRRGEAESSHESALVARRAHPRSGLHAFVEVDRASVWRSRPLRRGVLVLGGVPACVAMLAGLEWADLVVLPGLVAAGAALLFGVNTFALDGPGATWLASLPCPRGWRSSPRRGW